MSENLATYRRVGGSASSEPKQAIIENIEVHLPELKELIEKLPPQVNFFPNIEPKIEVQAPTVNIAPAEIHVKIPEIPINFTPKIYVEKQSLPEIKVEPSPVAVQVSPVIISEVKLDGKILWWGAAGVLAVAAVFTLQTVGLILWYFLLAKSTLQP